MASYIQTSTFSNKAYETVYKSYAMLMTMYMYQLQVMLHLHVSLLSPDTKRRRWTFMETGNVSGDGRKLFWKEEVNFVE